MQRCPLLQRAHEVAVLERPRRRAVDEQNQFALALVDVVELPFGQLEPTGTERICVAVDPGIFGGHGVSPFGVRHLVKLA